MGFKITGSTSRAYGLYDVEEFEEPLMHISVAQDLALRHGGGTNVHMGIGVQYSNIKYDRVMSTGQRIALEIRRTMKKDLLHEIVT